MSKIHLRHFIDFYLRSLGDIVPIMKILGIETSCDETAAAIIEDDGTVHANLVLSQLDEHRAFGGVVPEIAARAHIDHLHKLVKGALDDAGMKMNELDGVAATAGPGLIGGVMIGMMMAKSIAASNDIPFIGVNHLEGHALTPRLTNKLEFPYLLLLVSGGHSQILIAEDIGQYKLIGKTIDDALGECFDKSAKLMGLPYPGGPEIEKIALECKDHETALKRFDLPYPMKGRPNCDFSFSGLKTAVRTHIDKLPDGDLEREDIADLAYSFQQSVCEVLRDRLKKAIQQFKRLHPNCESPAIVMSGGVAANKVIRTALEELAKNHNMDFIAPPLHLCSDNAAMIAWAGIERLRKNMCDELTLKARPRWPLEELTG